MKRRPAKRQGQEMMAIKLPRALLDAIDTAVVREDSDRSKFVRQAIRSRLQELGIVPDDQKEAA